MSFTLTIISEEEARAVLSWRYEGPSLENDILLLDKCLLHRIQLNWQIRCTQQYCNRRGYKWEKVVALHRDRVCDLVY